MTFVPGRLKLPAGAYRPDITPHLVRGPEAENAAAPRAVNYYSKVKVWGELGNRDWGDCTCACDGHIAQQQTAYGMGRADVITDAEALGVYRAIAGFDIHAGPPGNNKTDRGATIQSALEHLRKRGIGGFKIAAYGSVDVKNHTAVMHAIEEFGALSVGLELPSTAEAQGSSWTVNPAGTNLGGHCVMACGYDGRWVYFISWGQVYRMSWDFWDVYVDEAWAIISEYWTSVTGLTLEAFGAEFAAAFGTRNPFTPSVIKRAESELEDEASRAIRWLHKFGYRGVHV